MLTVRYFNLKFGSKNVNGIVLRINTNPSQKLEKRVSEITGSSFDIEDASFSSRSKNEKINYKINLASPVNDSRKKIIQIRTDSLGNLEIVKYAGKVYVSEITKSKAYDLKQDAQSWRLTQGYCDGNLD